ncbi:hypothetical protein [Acetanaerobacterium elongatum]|uniref:Uncharacterized protein n=1 Tax=Acetanaerobacterium elongatum TaxID=258515 RepID=A0A1G9WAZ2_9FIRM|nr:hypothetical protein [Acetanaerobacterium elongatum]SDM81463.1 hypothetical protein SAMN05192585_10591 [Acetanaerobacterium elongatum]
MKQLLIRLAGLLMLFLLLLAAFGNAERFWEVYQAPVSLRYDTPLTQQQVENALNYAKGKQNEEGCCPTFWLQKNSEKVKAEYAEVSTPMIIGLGEGDLIMPARFITGGWPGVYDENGCAVSMQLAWKLWGDTDVLGKTVEYNKHKLIVRGVFEGSEPLIYTTGGTDVGYTCAELAPLAHSDRRQAAERFCMYSGLSLPPYMVYGSSMHTILCLLCWLTLALPAIVLLYRLVACLPNHLQRWAGLSLLFVVAVLLPFGLAQLPGWMVPTRWSDFAFWGRLIQTFKDCTEEWFALPVLFKDVEAKWLLVKQVLIFFASFFITILFITTKTKGMNGRS